MYSTSGHAPDPAAPQAHSMGALRAYRPKPTPAEPEHPGTTPEPRYAESTVRCGSASAVPLEHHEKSRVRQAARYATQVYPGPIGELISRELLTWEEFGYRLGTGSSALVNRAVDQILAAKRPTA